MTRKVTKGDPELLLPAEVASLFRVDPKTVTRWATAGRIGSIRTPGGHHRFGRGEVAALLASSTKPSLLAAKLEELQKLIDARTAAAP